MLESDCTVDEIVVDHIEDICGFESIISLLEGDSIEVNEVNCSSLDCLSVYLENDELSAATLKFRLGSEAICKSNAISRLDMKISHKASGEDELEFISSHFYEFGVEDLKMMKIDDLETVLSSDSLRLESEDSFLEVVSELHEEGLLRYVECSFLSESGIERFVELISREDFRFDEILWSSICRRLVRPLKTGNCEVGSERFIFKKESFPFEDSPFSGILSHLREKCGGNVHEKGIVSITSSGDECNQSWQVADHGWNDRWHSTNAPNSWICFEFKRNSISLQNYTVKSDPHRGQGYHHLREWVVEGSNDNGNWEILDSRNTQELNGASLVKTFKCSSENSSKFFRFVRLRQTGKNCAGYDNLMLTGIEFFGSLESKTV
jgi:hypothetical protein